MSAIGPKQTLGSAPLMSAFGCKADMAYCTASRIWKYRRRAGYGSDEIAPAHATLHPAELVALKSDVILATGDSTMPPLLQATRTVPIVFPTGFDPVDATGFMIAEYTMGGKWLELLKEIAPSVTRVAVI